VSHEHTTQLQSTKSASLPPRWFIRLFWVVQRAVYSVTRGRLGLRRATAAQWGMLRLRTVGRRTGEAHPDATVDLPGGESRAVHGRAANEDERPRLWEMQAGYDKDLDAYAARRSHETAVVILSPRPA
jgi:hypothetical protein